ncbi:MAG: FdhF/YdeP family oxidoreductase [Planctomycetes bacterium]|nr:FdhF/YdeP family oxidoreductase [Planctomycetota bacterium]
MNPRIGPPPERPLQKPTRTFLEALPFGIGARRKPRHFTEMLKVAWENRDSLKYAWNILRHGVCDGCSLGPYGLKDDVINGVHLCTTRLRLLRLNTMPAFDPAVLEDVEALRKLRNEELQALGRVPYPFVRRRGERGFRRVSWDEALETVAERLRKTDPDRMAWFATSRGLTNEAYYTFQKVARLLGSPHVDYCARLCHAPSTYGLADIFGVGAPNCSLKDFIGTDLLVLWGTNLANNQPVTTKYIHYAKKQGTRVAVVNPFREPGLEKYWVPSVAGSALFGTRLMDDYYAVRIGGDIAFANGTLKALKEMYGFRLDFLQRHGAGVEESMARLDAMAWEELERESGLPRSEMARFASIYKEAETAVFVYSMGLTQSEFGVRNVRSIGTLALARGMVGREKCGVMAIRGHSGVQGGAEVGLAPDKFPGGRPITAESAKELESLWGAPVPARRGLATPHMIEAAHEGRIDFLYNIGGNLLETMPDRRYVREAIGRIGVRLHQDIVVNTSTLLDGDLVVLLPAMTRYEQPGGCTATSTERRIRFSPEVPGPRVGEAKAEWEIPVLLARKVDPRFERLVPYRHPQEVREEIERAVPFYKGVASLRNEGDSVQWGGERLFEGGTFDRMPGGRARMWVQEIPRRDLPEGKFQVTTRRGKQFNSMVQSRRDPLTGRAAREAVFMCAEDARELGCVEGDRVRLRSGAGEFMGRVFIAPVRPRTLQLHWPEANVLIPRRYDPVSCEPDYNVVVDISKID